MPDEDICLSHSRGPEEELSEVMEGDPGPLPCSFGEFRGWSTFENLFLKVGRIIVLRETRRRLLLLVEKMLSSSCWEEVRVPESRTFEESRWSKNSLEISGAKHGLSLSLKNLRNGDLPQKRLKFLSKMDKPSFVPIQCLVLFCWSDRSLIFPAGWKNSANPYESF